MASVTIELIYETHSTSEDNERGIATGWLHGRLSELGRQRARALGQRHLSDGITAVFSSDLARAAETALIAFGGSAIPVLHDWRLRECDYGQSNGLATAELREGRARHLDHPYPGGESWRQAVARVRRFLDYLPLRWADQRVLVIGHVATRWGLEHFINGVPLEVLARADFQWQEGWKYRLAVPGE
jgi:2,3-bisphosphoglycerate-dependent phosphoglycerate mutase